MKSRCSCGCALTRYDDLVVLDVTASEQLADQYLDFASHGFHVISANKLAGASTSDKYRQIHDAFEKTGRHLAV
ncbi:bifunctional aspartate kinase II/homoserine dehydrogenase II [Citrobacter koseri]|uniref:Bifunctional aspartate kinase II/homoserine dehydrogenase II n=1 Tax=Citrobacter koseri TaxID=545 RepID=A0A2X2WMZ3_CITKO|nr:bifunctional aspartate kinase II/homoserine dehydrogenase II [Citrobacter koseri]